MHFTSFFMNPSSTKRRILWIAVSILCICSIAAEVYFYIQWKKATSDPAVADRAELQQIVEKIGEFMVLPTGEEPTLATVVDKSVLQDQTFFEQAENGDKVLIYTNARKAILYRPDIHKIIEVAPIYFQDTAPTGTEEGTPSGE